jgi:hypothetical protein
MNRIFRITGKTYQFIKSLINEVQTSIVAAATTEIGFAIGNYISVTGAGATITSLGGAQAAGVPALPAGAERVVVFEDINILTHNAVSLVLPTGDDITTQAGDTATFRCEGGGNWRCISYSRASGLMVGVPNYTRVTPASPTGAATAKMMGLAVAFTPSHSGIAQVIVSGYIKNDTADAISIALLKRGTGTAPVNGAASTGTSVGVATSATHYDVNARVPFTLMGIATSLVIGTPYWFDVVLSTDDAVSVAQLFGLSVAIIEI